MTDKPRRLRIRRCEANRSAWMLVHLRDDGTEIDSYGGYTTSRSLDALLERVGHLQPKPGDIVELIP